MILNICGVTFDHTTNYGSCYQSYALQTAIEKIKPEGLTCHYDVIPYALFRDGDIKKRESLVIKCKKLIINGVNKNRRKKFQDFEEKYMHYADCYDKKTLNLLNNQYDAFCCGGDVIWSLDFTKGDDYYSLAFAKKYKFSYGASFGVLNPEEDYEYIKGRAVREIFSNQIKKINDLGVRENSGKQYIKKIVNKEAQVVCDPVLLLSKNDWDKICIDEQPRNEYIFAYSTYICENYLSFLNKLKKQTGLKVIHVTWEVKDSIKRGIWYFPNPSKWLTLLKNAKYVVTNSFHGTAFCSIYHKNFFVVLRNEEAVKTGARIRIYDYLKELGLQDRMYGHTPNKIDTSKPRFDNTDQIIENMRNSSYSFLINSIRKAAEERI